MSQSIGSQYTDLLAKFSALTTRERALTIIATLSVILLGGYVLMVEPVLEKWDREKMEIQRQTNEAASLDAKIALLEQTLQEDPDASIKARLKSVKQKISKADEALNAQTENLVPASHMPILLEQVFAQFEQLKLVEMHSIAPTPLLKLEEEQELTDVNLYQHGVQMTLEGGYFEIQKYLQRVEALPYQFYWKKFEYKVEEYPDALVQIEIYTLSTSRAFIGVRNDS
ncbi:MULTISPECIES: type II secretion system protein GspM [Aliiglaciecola]|uniref:type II secretion system protein GspM n=1 Tax=Aliiglaciecola TaxID=1406885 RepID=UPI001C0A3D7D|nr:MULTISPECIES: type II secretion system protein GspM [Aliiglaciecola]MBU2880213.1 type II secretion system protein M [Aliiglaciecola lipolytica]MDO6713227.1 type II secretion system protein GspM [Aliiglaciecola sp. 2_MG-2023]MDO6754335.1 type II secretion system protein GspM [Aliiglaciecola sp. 1_MG-2023]